MPRHLISENGNNASLDSRGVASRPRGAAQASRAHQAGGPGNAHQTAGTPWKPRRTAPGRQRWGAPRQRNSGDELGAGGRGYGDSLRGAAKGHPQPSRGCRRVGAHPEGSETRWVRAVSRRAGDGPRYSPAAPKRGGTAEAPSGPLDRPVRSADRAPEVVQRGAEPAWFGPEGGHASEAWPDRTPHEWITEIPTVPIYYLAKPQPRERAWKKQRERRPC